MSQIIEYDRQAAYEYAKRWALDRNPKYPDFHDAGGNCTNFVSQCLYAGTNVMNFTKNTGWYYINLSNRAPAWSGVIFLHRFLLANKGMGPFGITADISSLKVGDIIFLHNGTRLHHSLLVVRENGDDPYIAANTNDAWMRRLSSYNYAGSIPVHILGARIRR